MCKNLISLKDRTEEERKRISKMGVEASIKKRRDNKSIKEELLILLSMKDENGISKQEKISLSLINEAEKGSVKAFELIQNIVYGKPVNKIDNNLSVVPIVIDDI